MILSTQKEIKFGTFPWKNQCYKEVKRRKEGASERNEKGWSKRVES
jgi:hypothetical protein